MRLRNTILIGGTIVVLGGLAAGIATADDLEEPASAVETAVLFDDLPQPVQTTLAKAAGDHKIEEIEEVRVGEDFFYEAEWVEDGLDVEVRIAADGTLLGRAVENPDTDQGDDEDDAEE